MSIITKRGDDGDTDLLFGRRISKTSPRIVALGSIDELNAALGLARAAGLRDELVPVIDQVQEKLIAAMGQLATLPEDRARYSYAAVSSEDIEWIEQRAREMEARGVRFTGWARPGAEGAIAAAAMDSPAPLPVAPSAMPGSWIKVVVKSAGDVLLFLNRLSDLLWILARVEEQPGGA